MPGIAMARARRPDGGGPARALAFGGVAFATVAFTFSESSLLATGGFANPIADELSLSAGEVGLLASALAVPFALVQVPAGILGDTWGLHRAFALSLSLFGAGFLLSATGDTFAALMAARAITGLGAGMIVPLASSLARRVQPEQNMRNQGIVGTGWGLGFVLGLLLLPLLFGGWRAAFAAFGACALALAAVAALWLPRGTTAAGAALEAARHGLRNARTWLLAVYMWGIGLANVGVGAWAIVYATDARGASETGALLLASLVGWGLLPASVVGTRAATRFGTAAVVPVSAIGLAAAVVALTMPTPLAVTALALFAVGWFTGFPFGVVLALIARIVEAPGSQAQGPVAGAINGFAFLGAVVAPPLVGFVYDATDSWSVAFASLLIGPTVALAASRTLTQNERTTSWASSTAR